MEVVERVAGHYEDQEVEFGRVYKWCPESVVCECKCGKRSIFKSSILNVSMATCECGEDCATDIQEEVVGHTTLKDDKALHPWRYWRSSGHNEIPF